MVLIREKKEKLMIKLNGFSDNDWKYVMKQNMMNGWKSITDNMCSRISDEGEMGNS